MQARLARDPFLRGIPAPLRRLIRWSHHAFWKLKRTRLLLTSVPKCGTHLLRELFHNVGLLVEREVPKNYGVAPHELREVLAGLSGEAAVGHIPAFPELREVVRETATKVLFIIRDPRDYVVSLMYHMRRRPDHFLHRYFREDVPDDDVALMHIIRGCDVRPEGMLEDVDTFFRWFLPWREAPSACTTSFERLIGPEGGGSAVAQEKEIRRLLAHVDYPLLVPALLRRLGRRIYTADSPTFRRGMIGSWRESFKLAHREAFKEVAGGLLIELGYEQDLDW
ncbi:MAG: sulfotransferase domain-containing protein [Acidobacteriota bacterium]